MRPSPRPTRARPCLTRRSPSSTAPTARAPPSTSATTCPRSAAEWKEKVGEGTSLQWPGGVGGKGNEAVAAYVKQIKGGIGYVELAYALQNAMPYASLQNATAGQWVQPTAETFAAAAAASADWANASDFNW